MKTISKAYSTAVYAENLEDIVFEGRNHKYGAYFLRTHYENHLLASLITVLIFASVLIAIPLVRAHFFPKPIIPPSTGSSGEFTFTEYPEEDEVKPQLPEVDKDLFQQLTRTVSIFDPVVVDHISEINPSLDLTGFMIDDIENLDIGEIAVLTPGGETGGEIEIDGTGPLEPFEVTEPAEFKFGDFSEWLSQTIVYNQDAISADISGRVVIRFTIDKEGRVSNIIVEKSLHSLLDQAVVDAVKKSPKWKPAKLNGNKVNVFCRVPVKFEVEK